MYLRSGHLRSGHLRSGHLRSGHAECEELVCGGPVQQAWSASGRRYGVSGHRLGPGNTNVVQLGSTPPHPPLVHHPGYTPAQRTWHDAHRLGRPCSTLRGSSSKRRLVDHQLTISMFAWCIARLLDACAAARPATCLTHMLQSGSRGSQARPLAPTPSLILIN